MNNKTKINKKTKKLLELLVSQVLSEEKDSKKKKKKPRGRFVSGWQYQEDEKGSQKPKPYDLKSKKGQIQGMPGDTSWANTDDEKRFSGYYPSGDPKWANVDYFHQDADKDASSQPSSKKRKSVQKVSVFQWLDSLNITKDTDPVTMQPDYGAIIDQMNSKKSTFKIYRAERITGKDETFYRIARGRNLKTGKRTPKYYSRQRPGIKVSKKLVSELYLRKAWYVRFVEVKYGSKWTTREMALAMNAAEDGIRAPHSFTWDQGKTKDEKDIYAKVYEVAVKTESSKDLKWIKDIPRVFGAYFNIFLENTATWMAGGEINRTLDVIDIPDRYSYPIEVVIKSFQDLYRNKDMTGYSCDPDPGSKLPCDLINNYTQYSLGGIWPQLFGTDDPWNKFIGRDLKDAFYDPDSAYNAWLARKARAMELAQEKYYTAGGEEAWNQIKDAKYLYSPNNKNYERLYKFILAESHESTRVGTNDDAYIAGISKWAQELEIPWHAFSILVQPFVASSILYTISGKNAPGGAYGGAYRSKTQLKTAADWLIKNYSIKNVEAAKKSQKKTIKDTADLFKEQTISIGELAKIFEQSIIEESQNTLHEIVKLFEEDAGITDAAFETPVDVPGGLPKTDYAGGEERRIRHQPGAHTGHEVAPKLEEEQHEANIEFYATADPGDEFRINYRKFFADFRNLSMNRWFENDDFKEAWKIFHLAKSVNAPGDGIGFSDVQNCFEQFKRNFAKSAEKYDTAMKKSDAQTEVHWASDMVVFMAVSAPEGYVVQKVLEGTFKMVAAASRAVRGVATATAAASSRGGWVGVALAIVISLAFYFLDPINKFEKKKMMALFDKTIDELCSTVARISKEDLCGGGEGEKTYDPGDPPYRMKSSNQPEKDVSSDEEGMELLKRKIGPAGGSGSRVKENKRGGEWSLGKDAVNSILRSYYASLEEMINELKDRIDLTWAMETEAADEQCETIKSRAVHVRSVNKLMLQAHQVLGTYKSSELSINSDNWKDLHTMLVKTKESVSVMFDQLKTPDTFVVVKENKNKQQTIKDSQKIVDSYIRKNSSFLLAEQSSNANKALNVDNWSEKIKKEVHELTAVGGRMQSPWALQLNGADPSTSFIMKNVFRLFQETRKTYDATTLSENEILMYSGRIKPFKNELPDNASPDAEEKLAQTKEDFHYYLMDNFNNVKKNYYLRGEQVIHSRDREIAYQGGVYYKKALATGWKINRGEGGIVKILGIPACAGIDGLYSTSNAYGPFFHDLQQFEIGASKNKFAEDYENFTNIKNLNFEQYTGAGGALRDIWIGGEKSGIYVLGQMKNQPKSTIQHTTLGAAGSILDGMRQQARNIANDHTNLTYSDDISILIQKEISWAKEHNQAVITAGGDPVPEWYIKFLILSFRSQGVSYKYQKLLLDFYEADENLIKAASGKYVGIELAKGISILKDSGIDHNKQMFAARSAAERNLVKEVNNKVLIANGKNIKNLSKLMSESLFYLSEIIKLDSSLGSEFVD